MVFLGLVSFTYKHEFYVSVGTLELSKNQKSLEFSAKFFTDDFEDALMADNLGVKREDVLKNHLVEAYLKSNITLSSASKNLPFEFLGFEIEDDVVWIYLEFEKGVDQKEFRMKNTMLINVRPRQVNIVHVKSKSTTTLSFNRRKSENNFLL